MPLPVHEALGLESVVIMWAPVEPLASARHWHNKIVVFFDLRDGRKGAFDYRVISTGASLFPSDEEREKE